MRKLAVALLLALCCATASADEPLRIGHLSLDFPDSWTFQKGQGFRSEGKGPDGEKVVLTYRVLKKTTSREVIDQHWAVIRNFARNEMPALASGKGNEVLRKVTESPLPNGRVQYSSVSKGTREGPPTYLLQYLLGSSQLIAYFTVEGAGDAAEAAARFEKILATQRWQE